MKKFKLLFMFSFLIYAKIVGQNEALSSAIYNRPKDIFYGTPDVTAFQKYNFLPINLYTGRINVSIPLFTINAGNITVPINISYNAGNGVKVDEIPSSVGLGWTLNAGGNITRVVKDINDFFYRTSSYGEPDWDHGCLEYFYTSYKGYHRRYSATGNNYNLKNNEKTITRFGCMPFLGGLNYQFMTYEDARPDEFFATAPMLNSKFHTISGDESDIIYEGVPKDGDNIKIKGQTQIFDYIRFEDTTLHKTKDYISFQIINSNGIEYTFDKYDKNLKYFKNQKYFPVSTFLGEQEVTSWHLTKILDRSTNKYINFEYEEYQTPIETYKYNTKDIFTEKASPYPSNTSPKCSYGFIPFFEHWEDLEYFKASKILIRYEKAYRLKKIGWDDGIVEFIYDNRYDSKYEKALIEIKIINKKNEQIKNYSLQYSYLKAKDNGPQEEIYRMILSAVNELNSNKNKINQYFFEYNKIPMPKKKSLEQDYLGYYNHNGIVTPDINSLDVVSPTLYYYPNRGKNSILPFPIQNDASGYTLPGNYSLLPDENYSQAGVLTKIIYPTGGWSEFEYENHRFNFLSKEYVAPGLRLKKQRVNNGNGQVHEYSYSYENGNIGSIPTFGYPWAINMNDNNLKSFVVYDKLKSGLELTQNSFIGYSKVIEKENGNGYKEFTYSNFNDYPNEYEQINMENDSYYNPSISYCGKLLNNNSSFFQQDYENIDLRRGNKLKENYFDNKNSLLKEINYKYDYKVIKNTETKYVRTYSYIEPSSSYPPIMETQMKSNLKIHRNLLKNKETKEYMMNGQIITSLEYNYHPTLPLIYEEIKDGKTSFEKIITRYQYPLNINNNLLMQSLISQNRISTPITTEVLRKEDGSEKQISFTETRYAQDASTANLILPKYIYTQKGEAVLEKKITYDSYDNKGNLLQYTLESGIPVSIIWGYNQQHPIAKIEGATYSEIASYVTNLQNLSNSSDEQGLLSAFTSLRNGLPRAMVTTYTYQPLVGVSTITSPNGLTEYYIYDAAGRLKEIKNQDGQLLKSFEYHYKSQN